MSLRTGTTPATATTAGDFHGDGTGTGSVDDMFIDAGWSFVEMVTAANAGTTGDVYVWAGPNASHVGNVWEGIIIGIEVDNTNDRLRIRACEYYDDSAASLTCKWFPTTASSATSTTPLASGAISDALQSWLGATNASQYITIPLTDSVGQSYWMGVNDDEFLMMTSKGGVQYWAHACILNGTETRYFGVTPATYGRAVAIQGPARASNTGVSMTFTANSVGGNVRMSREPNSTANVTGNWCGRTHSVIPVAVATSLADGFGDIGAVTMQWYSNSYMALPAWVHGQSGQFIGGNSAATKSRMLWWQMLGFVVAGFNMSTNTEQFTLGDTITADGTVYDYVGWPSDYNSTTGQTLASTLHLFVDGSRFS